MTKPADDLQPHPENTYWVLPKRFLAGEYPGHASDPDAAQRKIAQLLAAGVTTFIDLTEADEGLTPYAQLLESHRHRGIIHRRFPIRDGRIPSTHAATAETLDAIDDELARGRVVYVHCLGGIGRTGTIVGCWLSRHGHAGRAALDRLRTLWKTCTKSAVTASPETTVQAQYIIEWKEEHQ